MPKIQWSGLPRALRDHLFERLRERTDAAQGVWRPFQVIEIACFIVVWLRLRIPFKASHQYVSQQSVLHLYGWVTAKLPEWFAKHFPSEYHRKRLFKEKPENMPGVGRFENRDNAPMVSTPERALLELMDEVGVRPLQEAREIAEGTYNLRADVLMDLLKQWTSVKTVRGSARPWISKSKDGLLVLKP